MTHSLSVTASVICPECGTEYTSPVWLIIDVAEHPELLAQIGDGSLDIAECPSCSTLSEIPAPLLIFQSGLPTPLLFAPAFDSDAEEARADAVELIIADGVDAAMQRYNGRQ